MAFDDGLWFAHDGVHDHQIQFFDGIRFLPPVGIGTQSDFIHPVMGRSLFVSGVKDGTRYVHQITHNGRGLEDREWVVYADADDVDQQTPRNEDRRQSSQNLPAEGKETLSMISAMSGTPDDLFFLDATKHTIRHFGDFPSEYSGSLSIRYSDRKIRRAGAPTELAYTGDQKLFLIEQSSGLEYERHLPSAAGGTARIVEYGLASKERVLHWTHPGRLMSLNVANYPDHVAFLESPRDVVHFLNNFGSKEFPTHSEVAVPLPVNLVAFGKCFAVLSANHHAYVLLAAEQVRTVADVDFSRSAFVKAADKVVRLEADFKNNRLYLGVLSPYANQTNSLPSILYAEASDPKIFDACR